MNKYKLVKSFADALKQSRIDADKSQDFMAQSLGVSKRTIQNWENGIGSPAVIKVVEWFDVLNLQMLPYLLGVAYPNTYGNNERDNKVTESLIDIINGLPTDAQKKLLYILGGEHGSSPIAFLDLATAHLQSTMRDRVTVGHLIAVNYKIASNMDKLRNPNKIQPNIDLLVSAINSAERAVLDGNESYSSLI